MSFFKKIFKKKETVEQFKVDQVIHEEKSTQEEKTQEESVQETIEEKEMHTKEEAPHKEDVVVEAESKESNEEAVLKEDSLEEEVQEELMQIDEEPETQQEEHEERVAEEIEELEELEELETEELETEERVAEESEADEAETQEEDHVVLEEAVVQEEPKKKGLFSKLFSGLSKTRDNLLGAVDDVLRGFKKIDEELYEELEEALIMADFGVETTLNMMEKLRSLVKERKITEPSELKNTLQEIITDILTAHESSPLIREDQPNVILVIGVNGVGKTTTIGKLAHQLKEQNKNVVLAAADTFRAAAIEQLQIWADRSDTPLIKHEEGSDPAAVVFDGIKAAKARKSDVLICDTAGRLQNKTNLMKELEKMARIIEREYPEAHKEVIIVLDATTGQNALSQVKVFKEVAKVDGIVLTKLDGTAKGGAVVGICESLNVPVKYIGVGEKIDDLQPFDPEAFAAALFDTERK